jgi:hypothetical protein
MGGSVMMDMVGMRMRLLLRLLLDMMGMRVVVVLMGMVVRMMMRLMLRWWQSELDGRRCC